MVKIQLLFFSLFANLFFFNRIQADNDLNLSGIFLFKFQMNIYKNLYCGPIFGAGVDSKSLVGCGVTLDTLKHIINYLSINYVYFVDTNKHSVSFDFIVKYFVIFRIMYRSDGFLISIGLNFIEKILSKKTIVNANISFIRLISFEKNRNDDQNNLNKESNAKEEQDSCVDTQPQEEQALNVDIKSQEGQDLCVNTQSQVKLTVLKKNCVNFVNYLPVIAYYFEVSICLSFACYFGFNALFLLISYLPFVPQYVISLHFVLYGFIVNLIITLFLHVDSNVDRNARITKIFYDTFVFI